MAPSKLAMAAAELQQVQGSGDQSDPHASTVHVRIWERNGSGDPTADALRRRDLNQE